MSALALILMAGMTVPGDVPETVSAETELGLDLSGRWEGIWKTGDAEHKVERVGEGNIWFHRRSPRDLGYLMPSFTDEGEGRLRLSWTWSSCLGIYKQDGDRLIICFRKPGLGRPTSFRAGDGQELLILRRVKPRK